MTALQTAGNLLEPRQVRRRIAEHEIEIERPYRCALNRGCRVANQHCFKVRVGQGGGEGVE